MAKRRPETKTLGSQCWQALRSNKQLLLFPTISGIATLLIVGIIMSFALVIPAVTHNNNLSGFVFVSGGILVYVLATFVVTFCNAALVGACLKLLRGEPATVRDGFTIASSRLSALLGLSLLSSTVGLISGIIRGETRNSKNLLLMIVGALLSAIVKISWDVATFLILPIIIVENPGVGQGLKRSASLFKQTWANLVLGEIAIGTGSCLLMALAIGIGVVLIGGASATGSLALIAVAVALTVLALALVAIATSAVNSIYRTSLYLYATTGNAGRFLDSNLVYGLFNRGMAYNSAPRVG